MENRVDYATLDLQHIFGSLQPPDLSGGNKSKAAKLDGNDIPDFNLAYLGPQIWNNVAVSDDLKLEPINLDDLLNESNLDEGLGDLSEVLGNGVQKEPAETQSQVAQVAEGPQVIRESAFNQLCPNVPNFPLSIPSPVAQAQQPQEASPQTALEDSEATPAPSETDQAFDYEPNITDMMISTPLDEDENSELFDPRKRSFTDEELKPQPIIRKAKKVYVPNESKDAKYWHKREKNNAAAKRSREARRIKENQIAMRTKFLEKENDGLRCEVTELRAEVARLMKVVEGFQER